MSDGAADKGRGESAAVSSAGRASAPRSPARPRRAGAALVIGFLLCVALLLVSPFLLVRHDGVRALLLDAALRHAGVARRLSLRIERVARCDPQGLELHGITLVARGPEGDGRRVARLGRLAIRWPLREVIAGHLRASVVVAESLRVTMPHLALLAAGEGARSAAPRARSDPWARWPSLQIDRLRVDPLILEDSSGVRLRGEIALAELQASSRGLAARVDSGRAADPARGLELRARGGLASVRDGAASASELVVTAEGARARVRGQYELAPAAQPLSAFVDLEYLSPRVLARLLGADLPERPGDALSGAIEVRWGPGQGRVLLELNGQVLGEALAELSADVGLFGDTLELADLEVRADAGRVRGRARGARDGRRAKAELAWEGIDPRSPWLPWLRSLPLTERFSGSLAASLEIPPGEQAAISGSCHLGTLRSQGFDLHEVAFSGRVELGRAVTADTLFCSAGGGTLRAAGSWRMDEDRLDLRATLTRLPLAVLPAALRAQLDGSVSAELVVTGPATHPEIEGQVRAEQLRRGGWRADSLVAAPLRLRPRELRGAADLEVWGLALGDGDPADLRAQLARENDVLAANAHLEHARFGIELAAEIDPRGRFALEAATVRTECCGEWVLERPCAGGWSASEVRADSLVLVSGAARLVAGGRWEADPQAIDAHLSARDLNLAMAGDLLAGARPRGRAALDIAARGKFPDPEVLLTFRGDSLSWGRWFLGRAELEAAWKRGALTIGPVSLRAPGHGIRVPELRWTPGRPLLSWLGGDSSAAASLLEVAGASWGGGVEIDSLDLAATFSRAGLSDVLVPSARGASEARYTIAGHRVPIRLQAPWDPAPTTSGGGGLGGRARATLVIDGSPREPRLRCAAAVTDLRFAGVDLGVLDIDLSYADSVLSVERLQIARPPLMTTAHGFYPLHLAALPAAAVPLARPVGLQLGLERLDLELLSGLTRWLPDATGELSGQLVIEGQGTHPEVRGTLELSRGGLRIPGRSERLYEARGMVDVRRNRLRIRSLDARCGRHGTVTAVGTIDGPEDFDLAAHVENCRVFEEGRYDFEVTADVNAYTESDGAGGAIPHLRGVVEIHSGTLTQNLAAESGGAPAGERVPWVIDLDVEAPGNIRVSQANAKADVGEGHLYVVYRWPYWSATGTMRILGGTYRLFNNTFTVTGGSLEFRDTGAGPEVATDIDAETQVTVASEEGGPVEVVTVAVHVSGKPDALEIEFSSTPPLSEEEIAELLSYGRFTRGGRFEPAAETQWLLFNTMVERLETSLMGQLPIFSRVAIGGGTSTEDPMRVSVRPIVRPGFMVNYSQELSLDPGGELLLNYRLSRVLYLRGGLVRQREGSGGLVDEYSLDLKCRFEYD